jgi:hypothetical protein
MGNGPVAPQPYSKLPLDEERKRRFSGGLFDASDSPAQNLAG